AFNQKFGLTESLINVKNRYNRIKTQNDRLEVVGGQSEQDGQPLPTIITNAELYSRVKDSLLSNVDKVMNQPQEPRHRTRKIYSQEVNHEVLEMMNIVIRQEEVNLKANSLTMLNDIV